MLTDSIITSIRSVLGKGSFVGSGAVIKEGVRLGENVIVGADQVVLRDVSNGTVVKNAN